MLSYLPTKGSTSTTDNGWSVAVQARPVSKLPLWAIVLGGSAFHRIPQMTSRGLLQSSSSGRLISESANHSINKSISYD